MRTKTLGLLSVVFLFPILSASCTMDPNSCWLDGYSKNPCTIIGVMQERAKSAEGKAIQKERERAEEKAWAEKIADPEFQERLKEQLRLRREACLARTLERAAGSNESSGSGLAHDCY